MGSTFAPSKLRVIKYANCICHLRCDSRFIFVLFLCVLLPSCVCSSLLFCSLVGALSDALRETMTKLDQKLIIYS